MNSRGFFLLVGLVLGRTVLLGQNEGLDPGFGENGVAQPACGLGYVVEPWAACPWTEGRMLLAGDANVMPMRLMVMSVLDDGTLDPSFGIDGKVEFFVAPDYQRFLEIKVQANGRLLAAADLGGQVALVGMLADGSLDDSFGTNGVQFVAINSYALLQELEIEMLGDGRFLLGTRYGDDMAVMRFEENGEPDGTFGNAGVAVAPVPGTWADVRAMEILPNGRILIGGQYLAVDHQVWSIAEFLPEGTLALDFGTNGVVSTDVNPLGHSTQHVSEFAISEDGKIWVCGVSILDYSRITLARYLPNGQMDPEFNNGLPLPMPSPEPYSSGQIEGMALLANGDVLLGGNRFFWNMDTTQHFFGFEFCRVMQDGALRESFGQNGALFVPNGGISKEMFRDDEGRFVLVGMDINYCPFLARLDLKVDVAVSGISATGPTRPTIWPNPCSGEFEVALPMLNTALCSMRILDAQGRLCASIALSQQLASGASQHVSLAKNFQPGSYLLELTQDGTRHLLPFIAQ
ncbi:MAG: hypothetical protein IPO90_04870 [Flavobacteriales bacterium]|nr:hypothetical protein [Flavobacteriales bacterium]